MLEGESLCRHTTNLVANHEPFSQCRAYVLNRHVLRDDELLKRGPKARGHLQQKRVRQTNDLPLAPHLALRVQKRRVATLAQAQPLDVVGALPLQKRHAVSPRHAQPRARCRKICDPGHVGHLSNPSEAAAIWQMNRRLLVSMQARKGALCPGQIRFDLKRLFVLSDGFLQFAHLFQGDPQIAVRLRTAWPESPCSSELFK